MIHATFEFTDRPSGSIFASNREDSQSVRTQISFIPRVNDRINLTARDGTEYAGLVESVEFHYVAIDDYNFMAEVAKIKVRS